MAQLPRSNYPSEVAVYNRLKKFVKNFKKKNKRLPSKKEIQTLGKFDYATVIKYLDEGKDFLTFEEMVKTKQPPIIAEDLTPTQKKNGTQPTKIIYLLIKIIILKNHLLMILCL